MRIIFIISALALAGCTLDDVGATTEGVKKGLSEIPQVIADGATALETGGWTAAALVITLGLVKAGLKAWGAAREASHKRQIELITEGVKQANGRGVNP